MVGGPVGDLARVADRLSEAVVGRRREVELVLAALDAGRHIVIEGPPGTGKSTLLRAVAHEFGIGFEFVEGNAELTPARLVGHFDPARVLDEGYAADVFVDGPLMTALRDGALLYVEEINRVPEETLNVLITVMSERELHVPRLGRIAAAHGFRLVAAMNPFDAVGTARISSAIYDRVCRLAVDYQRADEEHDIVQRAVPGSDLHGNGVHGSHLRRSDDAWLAKVIEVVRATRSHPSLRVGSSVRGALDIAAVVPSLAELRGAEPTDPALGLDAALIALTGRVRVLEGVTTPVEEIVADLWWSVFGRSDDEPGDGGQDDERAGSSAGKVHAPAGADRKS